MYFFLICGTVFNFAELWWAMMIDSKVQPFLMENWLRWTLSFEFVMEFYSMILTFFSPLYLAVRHPDKKILQRQHSCLTNSLHLHLQTLITVHKDNYPAGTGGYPDTLRDVLKIFFSDPLFIIYFYVSLKRTELVSYRVYSGKIFLQIFLWKKKKKDFGNFN